MKLFRPSSLALTLVVGIGGPAALAQTTAAPAATAVPPASTPTVPPAVSTMTPPEVPAKPSHVSKDKSAHRGGGMNAYLGSLHDQLAITPAEEPLWSAFASTMHETSATMSKGYSQRREELPTQTALQNMDSFIALEQQRLDELKKSSAAFAALYGTMPPDQQKVADTLFRTDMPGAPKRRKPASP